MKVTKKTRLLAGTPLFEDPAIGLKINTIKPVGGTQFVLGGEARMTGANLRFASEGDGGFVLMEGMATVDGLPRLFTCGGTFAADGKSATLHTSEAADPIPPGEYEATISFATATADGTPSKQGEIPIALVVE